MASENLTLVMGEYGIIFVRIGWMQFSMARLLFSVLLINVLLCLTFAVPPFVGVPLLTLLSLIVLPSFVIVGVFNTRKARQAFFLGCMVAGTPHFIYSVYIAVMMAASFSSWDFFDDESWILQMTHFGGCVFGALGGLSGVGAYHLIRIDEKAQSQTTLEEKRPVDEFQDDETLHEVALHALDEEPVARLPK